VANSGLIFSKGPLRGDVCIPGDKSISHRYALLAAIADGESEIFNYATGADCQSTLSCIKALGSHNEVVEEDGRRVLKITGKGLDGLLPPEHCLDAGNSGSTIRMLSGILAGQPFTTEIGGDASLAKRPLRRMIHPRTQMGAQITAGLGQYLPLTAQGNSLASLVFYPPLSSRLFSTSVRLGGLS